MGKSFNRSSKPGIWRTTLDLPSDCAIAVDLLRQRLNGASFKRVTVWALRLAVHATECWSVDSWLVRVDPDGAQHVINLESPIKPVTNQSRMLQARASRDVALALLDMASGTLPRRVNAVRLGRAALTEPVPAMVDASDLFPLIYSSLRANNPELTKVVRELITTMTTPYSSFAELCTDKNYQFKTQFIEEEYLMDQYLSAVVT